MPKKKVVEIKREEAGPTCGECHWHRPWPGTDDVNRCMANPPIVLIDGDGDELITWPTPDKTEPACRLFKPKH